MSIGCFIAASYLPSVAAMTACTLPVSPLPIWQISDFTQDFTTPDLGGSVIFHLENLLTGFGALCFRRGLYIEDVGECFWTRGGSGEDDDTTTGFLYDQNTG